MEIMTGKERIMTALRNKQPDRVPASPDISTMIPTKLTGKPSWEVEFPDYNRNITFAYINAVKYFGIDGWLYNGTLEYKYKSKVDYKTKIISKDEEKLLVRTVINTPDGDLTQVNFYPKDNPYTTIEKPVKDFKKDFDKIKHLPSFSDPLSYDKSIYQHQKKALGEQGLITIGIWPPGLQNYIGFMDLGPLTYAYCDYPELFEELVEMHDKACIKKTEMAIDAGVDAILTGGSGSITLQSPELFNKLSLPTIKKITKMCKEVGIISMLHSCGKEKHIVEACANETDLDCINPLEIPPMGDCNLAECKKKFGHKLALMGNLHTTKVMLLGSMMDVRRESLKAILAAGQNGGFVLSTGDQCGRDTPFENIFEIVRVTKEFGTYPLDFDKIKSEIQRLEKT